MVRKSIYTNKYIYEKYNFDELCKKYNYKDDNFQYKFIDDLEDDLTKIENFILKENNHQKLINQKQKLEKLIKEEKNIIWSISIPSDCDSDDDDNNNECDKLILEKNHRRMILNYIKEIVHEIQWKIEHDNKKEQFKKKHPAI